MSSPYDPLLIQKLRRELSMREPGLRLLNVSDHELVKLAMVRELGGRHEGQHLRNLASPDAPPEEPEPPPTDEPTTDEALHWIGIEVVDDETEQPVDGVKLKLALPTGAVEEHTTGGDGQIRVRNLPSGTCTLEEMLDEEGLEVIQIA